MFITLPHNTERVKKANEELAALKARPLAERAKERAEYFKETASMEGDQDFTRIKAAEGRFIDLAIHKDTFLDDAAVISDLAIEDVPYWKSRYAPVVGVTTGSVYGNPMMTLYATQDHYATLTPFVYEAEEVKVPKLALTQDVARLGQREAGLERQAEAMKLAFEQFVVNVSMGQPLGTDLATSVSNYIATGNPYSGKTVYVADPGVQTGTYETTNIVSIAAEAGLSPAVIEAILAQAQLQRRRVRTIHIPVAGQPWRKLLRVATIVANQSVFGAGVLPNAGLKAVPEGKWADIVEQNMFEGNSIVLNIFGNIIKFKSNNALPQGTAIVTTDEPMVEVFNMMKMSVSLDYAPDPRDQFFVSHYEKRELAIAQPDPWLRNFMVVSFGSTANL